MDFIRPESKDRGTFIGNLPYWLVYPLGRKCPQKLFLPSEVQRACMRLGVPLSLFAGLMNQTTATGLFALAGRRRARANATAAPFQAHHYPPAA